MPDRPQVTNWTLVVGVAFLAVSLIFFMALIVIATIWERQVPAESRFLVVVVLAITTGAASGFLGGYARAAGKISLPYLKDPVSFGITGGMGALVLVIVLGYWLYSSKSEDRDGGTNKRLASLEQRLERLEAEGFGSTKDLTAEEQELVDATKRATSLTHSSFAARQDSNFWQAGSTINVSFLDGDETLQTFVKGVASDWTSQANVEFSYVEPDRSVIRVSFEQPGGWSYTGSDSLVVPVSEPTMSLGVLKSLEGTNLRRRTVLHNFGHALGLMHEHQNPNAKIPWNWEFIYQSAGGPPMFWSRSTIDYNLRTPVSISDYYRTKPFDPRSVMMYQFPAEWLAEPLEIPGNGSLSPGDVEFIRRIYPPGANG